MEIIWKQSPNFNSGRQRKRIKKIVIHWIGAGTAESAVTWLCNPVSKVSAHYVISGTKVWQLVQNKDTAWHAGDWDTNLESIGIEHDATPEREASALTYFTSAELIRTLASEYQIPLDREHIIGHSSVKATRCPGTMNVDRLIQMAKEGSVAKLEERIEELEIEIQEIRESRNRWRTMYKDETEKLAKEISEKNSNIEAQQKQISTLNESLVLSQKDMEAIRAEKKLLESNLEAQKNDYEEQLEQGALITTSLEKTVEKQEKTIKELRSEVESLKSKMKKKLYGYSWWTRLFSLFRGGE